MPLKVNVGLTRKVGESNYGSRGASVNVELELESALAGEPAKLQERIRQLFDMVRASVAEELHASPVTNGSSSNGHTPPSEGNGTAARKGSFRAATQSQVRALLAIAKSKNVNLTRLLRGRHHVDRPDELSVQEASALIDLLKKPDTGGQA